MLWFQHIKSLDFKFLLAVYTAILSTIIVIIQTINLIKSSKKEVVKLTILAERDLCSPLARQKQNLIVVNFIVTNKSSFPITVNQVGFICPNRKFIDVVFYRYILKQNDPMFLGLEYAIIPGEIKSMSKGMLKIEYNRLPKEIQDCCKQEIATLELKPFAIIPTGKTFIGKKTSVKLNNSS